MLCTVFGKPIRGMGAENLMRAHTRLLFVMMWIAGAIFQIGCHKQLSVIAPVRPPAMGKSVYSATDFKTDQAAYDTNLNGPDDAATAKRLRNKIVYGLMGEMDDAYGQFTKNLYSGKGAFGVAGDSALLGLTAAATIATHTPTKTILSALGTAVTGVNLSVDKNFFAQQTYQTIAVAMQTRRDKARNSIISSLDKDDEDYPLGAAKRDLFAYFYAGTLPGGLQELQEEAGAASKVQQDNATQAIH
jgi:hypothetical protein